MNFTPTSGPPQQLFPTYQYIATYSQTQIYVNHGAHERETSSPTPRGILPRPPIRIRRVNTDTTRSTTTQRYHYNARRSQLSPGLDPDNTLPTRLSVHRSYTARIQPQTTPDTTLANRC